MKNKYLLYPILILFFMAIPFFSFGENVEKNPIHFALQDEMEINKYIDFVIYLSVKPDVNSLQIYPLDNWQLTESVKDIEDSVHKVDGRYIMYCRMIPQQLGEQDFPIIRILSEGIEYHSEPARINIVKKIEVKDGDVRLKWQTDKQTYTEKEKVIITLYQYSRYIQTYHTPSFEVEEKSIPKNFFTIDRWGGIKGFEELLKKNFEIIDFNKGDIYSDLPIEIIEGKPYFRTIVLQITLLPKQKGVYEFPASRFDGYVFGNTEDSIKSIMSSENKVNLSVSEFKLISNELRIKVE